jgi:DNA-binding Lrp family transcriptional regulator
MAIINKEIAKEYGMTCAVVFQYIAEWVVYNAKQKKNFADDRYWTYNTQADISEALGLSREQVNRSLKRLVKDGLLVAQNLNPNKQLKMLWYSLSDLAIDMLFPEEKTEENDNQNVKKVENTRTPSHCDQMSLSKCANVTLNVIKSHSQCDQTSQWEDNTIYKDIYIHNKQHKKQQNNLQCASPTPSNRAVDEPTSPTAKSDAHAQTRTQGNCPFFDILKAYQSICTSYPSVSVLDGDRRKAVIKLWKRYGNLTFFTRAFEKAQASAYLRGTNDRKWHADFDWIVKESNFAKILDGKFDVLYERKQKTPSNRLEMASFTMDDINAVMKRAYGG